jgi:hypothetical protein
MIRALVAAFLACNAFGAATIEFTRYCAGCKIWGAATVASHTGQFVVHGSGFPKRHVREANTNVVPLINVEPQMLAVTAERTKRAFLQELRQQDVFRDKIHAIILDFAAPSQPVQLISEVYLDGFQYRLAIPGRVEHTRLVRALTQTLLLEFGNRGSKRSAELPRWLIEGMTRQVLSSVVPTYVVNEEMSSVEVLGYDRLSYSRAYLSTNTPMTVQELSFHEGDPAQEQRFEACAHMMVHELLKLQGGPGLMVQFLRLLPHTLNWQTAFFQVYGRHFAGPLALEKWWMLAWTDQKNRPAQAIWPKETALDRLNALLLTSMETSVSTNSIPQRRDVPLQELLARGNYSVQRSIFSQKVQQLYFIGANLPAEVAPLARAYRETLENYLQRRGADEAQPGLKKDPEQRAQVLTRTAARALDQLDSAREDLKAGRPLDPRLVARRGR